MIEAGLILEGGAERGIFTAGALDALMEKGMEFSYVCGVSAGACNAVDYVSRQIGRSKRVMIPSEKKYRMAKVSAIPSQHAYIDMDMLFDDFPNRVFPFDYETYFASPIRCEMVVTNALTGCAEYMDSRDDRQAMMDICRASSSIPIFTPMAKINGTPYVDGSVSDAIPIVHSLQAGYRKNLVILTRMADYEKTEPGKAIQAIYRAYLRKYPALLRVMLNHHKDYNRQLALLKKWEAEGKVFVLRPEMPPVDRLEYRAEKLEPFYQHGYDLMERRMDELTAYLEK